MKYKIVTVLKALNYPGMEICIFYDVFNNNVLVTRNMAMVDLYNPYSCSMPLVDYIKMAIKNHFYRSVVVEDIYGLVGLEFNDDEKPGNMAYGETRDYGTN